ncbi:FtsW/RodA/SpoVE family cell cycle protein [Eubacteriales bacterium OttesenSCG-928-A19]|nr:FtsW/RodA/SpoVE family cell cycle protein [Eubacteriales bacterium OttesenSCG-928-A19]
MARRQRAGAGQKANKRFYSDQRSTTRLTLAAIMLFECTASLLLMFRGETIDPIAGVLAIVLPFLAWLSVRLSARRLKADVLLVMIMNFLCGLGIILLYCLSPERGLRQAWIYLLGLVMFIACTMAVRMIRNWKPLCWLMMLGGVLLLLLPVAIGQETNGAKNWFSVPFFGSFQPSEIVKLCLLLVLSQFFSSLRGLRGMLPGLVFAVACLGVLMLQKDLGTALMYYIITLLMYWAASSNLPITALGAAGGVGAAYLGYEMFGHVRTRVAIWQNPWSDALGKGYQLVQALTAIGSGGLLGLGLGLGKSRAIPAYSTDFIFAVLCEQFGILFGLCVVGMYVIIMLRGIAISLQARTPFHALLALGAALFIGLQAFVIIGGVIKLIPLTGITMPFVSYGGTSLVTCMGMIGLLCGVSARNDEDRAADVRLATGAEEAA